MRPARRTAFAILHSCEQRLYGRASLAPQRMVEACRHCFCQDAVWRCCQDSRAKCKSCFACIPLTKTIRDLDARSRKLANKNPPRKPIPGSSYTAERCTWHRRRECCSAAEFQEFEPADDMWLLMSGCKTFYRLHMEEVYASLWGLSSFSPINHNHPPDYCCPMQTMMMIMKFLQSSLSLYI